MRPSSVLWLVLVTLQSMAGCQISSILNRPTSGGSVYVALSSVISIKIVILIHTGEKDFA